MNHANYLIESLRFETDDCMIWPYGKNRKNYGQVYINKRTRYVHRIALESRIGKSPIGKNLALHKPFICHNPSCYNYRHLYWGDSSDNQHDRVEENLNSFNRGSKHGRSKLTDEQVLKIFSDNRRHEIIAKDYSVSRATIGYIKSSHTWSHLTNK